MDGQTFFSMASADAKALAPVNMPTSSTFVAPLDRMKVWFISRHSGAPNIMDLGTLRVAFWSDSIAGWMWLLPRQ